MYILNITFMMVPESEPRFRELIAPTVSHCREDGLNPRLSRMREAGGVEAAADEALSIAFQIELPTIEEARRWHGILEASAVAEFIEAFAPEAITFASIFETIDI